MNKIMRLTVVMVAILFSTIVSADLFAMDYGRGKGPGAGEAAGRHDRGGEFAMFAKLNLTNEQKARIRALREAHLRAVKPLQDQMFSKSGDMKLLWLQTAPDKEKIVALRKEIRELRDQIQDKATAHRVDMFNVLTPEQQDKVRLFRSRDVDHPMRGGDMREPRPGMMGPGFVKP
jgi:Spy/CpxP family protein refolding chaperone